jgi:hypothetical protein
MNMYQASAGYTLQGKKLTNSLVVNYVKNNSDLLSYDLSRQYIAANTFMLSNTLQHKASGTALALSLNMMSQVQRTNATDSLLSSDMKGAEITLVKKLALIKGSAEAGYAYLQAQPALERHGIKAGVSTTFSGFIVNIRAEKYYTTRAQGSYPLSLCRLTLIKPF